MHKYLTELKRKLIELTPSEGMLGPTKISQNKIRRSDTSPLDKSKRRIEDSSWVSLPNIVSMKMTLQPWSTRWAELGIRKRVGKPEFEFELNNNRSANKYAEKQIKRLKKLATQDPAMFWKVAKKLIAESSVFRVMAIEHVLGNWYKEKPLWYVMMINRKVNKLINTESTNMESKRVYIPKGDTYRPLGVPKTEWRILMHMWANFLTLFLKENKILMDSWHGFIPTRGCLSAWRSFFKEKLHENAFIYEIDLKQFFPTCHVNYITEILLNLKIPKDVVYYLENINRRSPELPTEVKLDESIVIDQNKEIEDLLNGRPNAKLEKWVLEMKEKHPDVYENAKNMICEEEDPKWLSSDPEFAQILWALLDSIKPTKTPGQFNGVPQGLPTSPILSITTLHRWLSEKKDNLGRKLKHLFYADDGIFFSNIPFSVRGSPEEGIRLNEEKSQWVKSAGVWQKPLKFLGLEFDGNRGTLMGKTRKGSRLELSQEVKYLAIDESPHKEGDQWERLVRSPSFGFIISGLYCGTYNHRYPTAEFRYRKDSWAGKTNKSINLYNCSSYATNDLLDKLPMAKWPSQ